MIDLFEWDERYSVGVHQFDSDHRRLLELAHRMVNETLLGPLPENPGDVLDELIEAAVVHFAHEERLLGVTAYPDLEEHQRQHRRLLEDIRAYQKAFSEGKVQAADVAQFVADWIFSHMEEEDQKYTEHLNGHGYR